MTGCLILKMRVRGVENTACEEGMTNVKSRSEKPPVKHPSLFEERLLQTHAAADNSRASENLEMT
jgi:hypothetical protein